MDALALARIQFAFTVGYHFIFVPLSMGLSLFVLLYERRHYRTRAPDDRAAADFWIKLFASTFAMGVATGIVMEFAFGTNWAGYSRFVGDVFGPPLAAEGILSFFLESTFLGILLFGRGRVSPRVYYASAVLVFVAAHLSAVWILIANSWQQTPAGYEIIGGKAVLTDISAALLNPSIIPRLLHTVTATWVTGAFVAAGIAAYHVRRGTSVAFARRALVPALVLALVFSLAMPAGGHYHAVQVAETQPTKMAAFEGVFETGEGTDMMLFGWVDEEAQQVRAGLPIPGLLSLLLTGSVRGEVIGLDAFPASEWPPLQMTFQSYHLMVALGVYFIGLAALGLYLAYRRRLYESRRYLKALVVSAPLPILAAEVGWIAAEVGRQPWVVYGELRTSDAVSAVVPAAQVAASLALFAALYLFLFVVWARIAGRIIKAGPGGDQGQAGSGPADDSQPEEDA